MYTFSSVSVMLYFDWRTATVSLFELLFSQLVVFFFFHIR